MKNILVVEDDRVTRHLLESVLKQNGYAVSTAADGNAALALARRTGDAAPDLILLDVWMPGMSGLDVLSRLRDEGLQPRVVVMTSDETPATLLQAVRDQAFTYVHKPVDAEFLIETVRLAIAEPETRPIEVISARPEWVELILPCTREAANRLQSVMAHLDTDLPAELRDSIAYAFRELLLNAVEWGGKLDPKRRVRIAYVRTKRMLLYRIADPGQGFKLEGLSHAAISHPNDPIEHMRIREEKGLRPGGFGLLMVRAKVDELVYNEQQNEVLFMKYLKQ